VSIYELFELPSYSYLYDVSYIAILLPQGEVVVTIKTVSFSQSVISAEMPRERQTNPGCRQSAGTLIQSAVLTCDALKSSRLRTSISRTLTLESHRTWRNPATVMPPGGAPASTLINDTSQQSTQQHWDVTHSHPDYFFSVVLAFESSSFSVISLFSVPCDRLRWPSVSVWMHVNKSYHIVIHINLIAKFHLNLSCPLNR